VGGYGCDILPQLLNEKTKKTGKISIRITGPFVENESEGT
jgi:hypothetical protein